MAVPAAFIAVARGWAARRARSTTRRSAGGCFERGDFVLQLLDPRVLPLDEGRDFLPELLDRADQDREDGAAVDARDGACCVVGGRQSRRLRGFSDHHRKATRGGLQPRFVLFTFKKFCDVRWVEDDSPKLNLRLVSAW